MAGEKIGEGYVEVRLNTSRLGRETEDVQRSMQRSFDNVSRKMQDVGKTMTKRITLPLVGLGTTILKTAMDFERSMNRVGALTGATGDSFDRLNDQAKELGRTTVFTASQAAEGMAFLAMAGFDANTVYESMPGVLNIAAAAQLDLASAADIATNILTGFGMEASELEGAMDVMTATFTNSNTSMVQLGDAMKYAAPLASAAGLSFEETAAAIGLMGNAGIQSSMAGTSLRGALVRLLNPTAQVQSALDRLGITAHDSSGELLSLGEILVQLEEAAVGPADMMTIFGLRAGPGMMALLNQGTPALREFTGLLEESGGIAAEVAERQLQGLYGAFIRMKSAMEGAAIAIADSGLLGNAAAFSERMAEWFIRLAETNPQLLNLIVTLGGVAAAVGPATWAIGGMLSAIKTIFGLLNPFTIAAIGVGAAIYTIGRDARESKKRIAEMTAELKSMTGTLQEASRDIAANRLFEEEADRWAKNIGVSFATVVDAATGVPGAFEEVRAAAIRVQEAWSEGDATDGQRRSSLRLMETLRELSPELSESRDRVIEYQREMAGLDDRVLDVAHALELGLEGALYSTMDAHDDASIAAANNTSALGELQAASGMTADELAMLGVDIGGLGGDFDDMGMDAESAASTVRILSDAFGEVAEEARSTIDVISEYNDELRAMTDPVFAASRATDAFEQSQRDLTRAYDDRLDAQAELNRLQDEGADPDEIAAATRRLEDATDGITQAYRKEFDAAVDAETALRDLWAAMEDGTTSAEQFDGRVQALIETMGLSDDTAGHARDQFLHMIEAMLAIPEVEIELDTRQQAKFDDLIAHIDGELAHEREKALDFDPTEQQNRFDDLIGHMDDELRRERATEIQIETQQQAKFDDLISHMDDELAKQRATEIEIETAKADEQLAALLERINNSTARIRIDAAVRTSDFRVGGGTSGGFTEGNLTVRGYERGNPRPTPGGGRPTGGFTPYADGGRFTPGWALVGEDGPEFVRFDGSGTVFDADETARMLAGPDLSVFGSSPLPPPRIEPARQPQTGGGSQTTFNFQRAPEPEELHRVRVHEMRRRIAEQAYG